jgi:hypothetical protein
MGYMIEITEKKVEKLSDHIEQGLRHLGKAMQCVDEWMQEEGMGERSGSYGGRYGGRGGYGYRGSMGYRDEEDWEDMDERYEDMGERRGRRRRDSRGRYM